LCSSASGATKSVSISPELRRPTEPRDRAHPVEAQRGTEPQKITLVHKAAILNSLTGLYQEANKRDSKCDTVHFVCASASSGAMSPVKSGRRCIVPTCLDIKVALSSQTGSRLSILPSTLLDPCVIRILVQGTVWGNPVAPSSGLSVALLTVRCSTDAILRTHRTVLVVTDNKAHHDGITHLQVKRHQSRVVEVTGTVEELAGECSPLLLFVSKGEAAL
ncbi:hypothetical protein INR49_031125, partial [Caranx melampygus]